MYYITTALALLLTFIGYLLFFPCKDPVPKGTRLPPGPTPKYFVGNVLDIPPYHSWLKFKEWSDQYGPVFRFSVFGKQHYVLSTEKAANDLLRDRGSIYSSRATLPAAGVLLADNQFHVLLPIDPAKPEPTETWRKGRKFLHQNMGTAAVLADHAQIHDLESSRLVSDLLRSPTDYQQWYERYAAGIVFRLGYGKPVETGKEPYVETALRLLRAFERAVTPGVYLVDVFPILMHLPQSAAPFKRDLLAKRVEQKAFNKELQDMVRQEKELGTAPPSLMNTFLQHQQEVGLSDAQGAVLIEAMFGAGSGTTAAALMSFTLAMVHSPLWLRHMQEELDKVVGSDRLPTFDDLELLPTVRAVVKETLRWRPVTAGGIPHKLIKDDVYQDMFFPAGTIVHFNEWAIHRDPVLYPDPESFRPDRWLSSDFPTFREPLSKYPNLQGFSAFGFGRRLCPGLSVAERSLNIAVARIAWACSISKQVDKSGKEIDVPLYDYVKGGINAQPNAFPFRLTARSQQRVEVLRRALDTLTKQDPLR